MARRYRRAQSSAKVLRVSETTHAAVKKAASKSGKHMGIWAEDILRIAAHEAQYPKPTYEHISHVIDQHLEQDTESYQSEKRIRKARVMKFLINLNLTVKHR